MREVAHRVFATEFNDATHTFRESDDDRAPVYALLPTGAKANRVFVVGTLTETEDVGEDDEYWQGRIVDPTGTVFVYAGQYQPEAAGMLRETEPPAFVALVGKPRTYETDDGSVNVSLRPEHLTIVDESTRNRWVTETAKRTLDRIDRFDDETNEYAGMARDQYGDAVEQYRQAVITAVESLDNASEDTATPDAHETGADTDSVIREDETESATSMTDGSAAGSEEAPTGESGRSDSADELGDFDAGDVDSDT
jgi:RPA family protein